MRDVFFELDKVCDFKLKFITNFDYEISGLDIEVIRWNKKNEVRDLQSLDIGVYPLEDSQWVKGKSGLKAIQYMALGIPTVASNVGNTREVIEHMIDGILVNSEHEWYDSFINLIDNIELRKILGINAKKKIMNKYNLDIISKKYLEILNN